MRNEADPLLCCLVVLCQTTHAKSGSGPRQSGAVWGVGGSNAGVVPYYGSIVGAGDPRTTTGGPTPPGGGRSLATTGLHSASLCPAV